MSNGLKQDWTEITVKGQRWQVVEMITLIKQQFIIVNQNDLKLPECLASDEIEFTFKVYIPF